MLKYYLYIYLLFIIVSCTDEMRYDVAGVVNISCGINEVASQNSTRTDPTSSNVLNRTTFNLGDEVMLSCFKTSQSSSDDYRKYRLTDLGWSNVDTQFEWSESIMRFSAYYPSTATATTFDTPADQSSIEKIAMADLMRVEAVDKRQSDGEMVELSFVRQMAYVEFSVVKYGDIYDADENYITDVKIFDYEVAEGGAVSLLEITPYEKEAGVYSAIIKGTSGIGTPPDYDLITFKDAKGQEYSVSNTTYLLPRYKHTISLVVGGNRDNLTIESIDIEPWSDPIYINGGDFTVTEIDKSKCIDFNDDDLKMALVQQHNYVLPSGEMAYCIDTNGNGEIEFEEAAATTQIAIGVDFDPLSYDDLYAYFATITEFRHLKEIGTMKGDIDLSKFPNLKILDLLATTSRVSYDLTECPYITELYLFATPTTTSVDLRGNRNLSKLILNVEGLQNIDLTNNIALEEVTITDTPLLELDLSSNILLSSLYLESAKIVELDLSKCVKLKSLSLEENEELALLDMANLVDLNTLYCNVAAVKTLDLSQFVELRSLHWGYTGLESISLDSNENLNYFRLEESKIKELDISNNNKLSEFMARYIETLTISEAQNLSPGVEYWSSKISVFGDVVVK